MLLNSVIIVLREVLEAALMLSVLLAISRFLGLGARWIALAIPAGLLGSAVYGYNMQVISDLFDGVGQEVIDASLQYLVFAVLAAAVFLIVCRFRDPTRTGRTLPTLMAVASALALTREGAEILIYVVGFWQLNDFLSSIGIGSLVGASIGLSVGVLFYYLLLSQPSRRALPLAIVLLGLIGAGMCAQATGLLIQADWMSVAGPLWNTSDVLPEDSVPGQLLYALLGYEASPSGKEVTIYASSLLIMVAAVLSAVLAYRTREVGA